MAKISTERENFSIRLQNTLRNAHHSPDSPTELARDFNARFSGRPVTVHAARKWLVAEAIPTQDKLRTLAKWLGVSVEWLRFGGDEPRAELRDVTSDFNSDDMKLIADFQMLSDHDRQIVREFVRLLVRAQRQEERMLKQMEQEAA